MSANTIRRGADAILEAAGEVDGLQVVVDRLEELGFDPEEQTKGWLALCPVHGDRNPSLAFDEGENGGVVFHCRSQGCEYADILKELDLRSSELGGAKKPEKAETEYVYVDEDGVPVRKVVRKRDKKFSQAWWNDDQWDWKGVAENALHTLYRLPDVLSAVEEGETIYVCEGEKDAEALVAAGVVATTNPGGAGSWRAEYSKSLAGAGVIVVADKDTAGRRHAAKVAKSLRRYKCKVSIVEALFGNDAHDHLRTKTVEDFVPVDETEELEEKPETHFALTDLGNSKRLALHSDAIRYVPGVGWHAWDGKRWRRDSDGEALRQAEIVCKEMREEANEISDRKLRDRIWKWSSSSESKDKLTSAVAVAQSNLDLIVHPEKLDSDGYRLNVENGTLDLRTGDLRKHDAGDLISNLAPVVWDPDATDPVFDDFLLTIFEDRPEEIDELVTYLQRFVGYALTGDVTEERALFLHGGTATGKSTILEAVKAMLGAYAIATEAESFCKKRFGGAVRNDIVRLRGKRIALCSEVEEGKEFDVALLNSLIAGDTQTARELYHEFIEFAPQFKLLFAANSRPKVPSGAEALWRRIDQIPFTNSHKGKTNESIKEHLTRDPVARSALLAWAVQGCLDWQRERLATPEAVQRYTEEYRAENEPIQAWIDEACKQGKREKCLAKPLLESFNEWASENGEEWATAKSLAKELTRPGFKREHTENGAAWKGLALV